MCHVQSLLHIPRERVPAICWGIPRFSKNRGIPPKIREFPECSPFSLPGNVAFGSKKFLKVSLECLLVVQVKQINQPLNFFQGDQSFKPIKSDSERFFSHG